jgi:hypothetical protein
MMEIVVDKLLNSDEPSVRYKVMVNVLDYDPETAVCQQLRQAIKTSPRAQKLLSGGDEADDRTDELADRLVQWQWPDGGWNCDKNPAAQHSSFMESLIPLRGLAGHARLTGNPRSRAAAERAADIFLKRHLFQRQTDGTIIDEDFVRLHYPCYWHYDILFGLKVMAEAGFIGDSRCRDALALLAAKRLPDGGFPAEKKYYRATEKRVSGRSLVNWGGVSRKRMNEFVTADALYVLKAGGNDFNTSRR